jgi:hypothetical protein
MTPQQIHDVVMQVFEVAGGVGVSVVIFVLGRMVLRAVSR